MKIHIPNSAFLGNAERTVSKASIHMKQICIRDRAGAFAENKDVARTIRIDEIIPALEGNEAVVLDFDGVDAATQSFIHALISDLLRKYGSPVFDRVEFKSCNETIKKIISIVADYMQEGLESDPFP